MSIVIGYKNKGGSWAYWTSKHGFAIKNLSHMSTYNNRQSAAKTLALAIEHYPNQFGKFHPVDRLYLRDQNNSGNDVKWTEYRKLMKEPPIYTLMAVNENSGTNWSKLSDDTWTVDATDKRLSKWTDDTVARMSLAGLDMSKIPTQATKVGVRDLINHKWIQTIKLTVRSESESQSESTVESQVDSESVSSSESIVNSQSQSDNSHEVSGQDLFDGLADLMAPDNDPLISNSVTPQLDKTPSDLQALLFGDLPKDSYPMNQTAENLINNKNLNIDDVLHALHVLSVLAMSKDALAVAEHKLDVQDTQDLLHVIELDNLSDQDKIQVLDALTKVRQARRQLKDLAGFAEAVHQSFDFDEMRKLLDQAKLSDIKNRNYAFRNKNTIGWIKNNLDNDTMVFDDENEKK